MVDADWYCLVRPQPHPALVGTGGGEALLYIEGLTLVSERYLPGSMSQPSSDTQRQPAIVILDFGSQYSELIARRVRETEVFSVVLGYSTSAEELRRIAPKGIILSGGPR